MNLLLLFFFLKNKYTSRMYRMTQFELYLNQFNTTIDASAAHLPDTQYDVSLGTYDLVFDTSLSLSLDIMTPITNGGTVTAFQFLRDGDALKIAQHGMSFGGNNFSVQQATYKQAGNTSSPNNVAIWSGMDAPRVLVEEYLAYIAKKELGSANLVGAFDNYQTIYNSVDDSIVVDTILTALAQGVGAGTEYIIPNFITNSTVAGDNSPLWNIYSYVLENFTSRLTDAVEGEWTNFLQVGDILDIKVTVSTPAIDSSIADANGAPVNGNKSYTPVHPDDRVYLVKIHIIA
jgi:hypothetical protein